MTIIFKLLGAGLVIVALLASCAQATSAKKDPSINTAPQADQETAAAAFTDAGTALAYDYSEPPTNVEITVVTDTLTTLDITVTFDSYDTGDGLLSGSIHMTGSSNGTTKATIHMTGTLTISGGTTPGTVAFSITETETTSSTKFSASYTINGKTYSDSGTEQNASVMPAKTRQAISSLADVLKKTGKVGLASH